MKSNKQFGVGLLETLCVLAVMLAVLIVGYRSYQEMVFEKDAALIQMNANYLLQGLKLYYYQNCVNNPSVTCPAPTISDVLSELQMTNSSSVMQNPWAADQTQTFTLPQNVIATSSNGAVMLTVSSVINIPVNTMIINLLGASTVTGTNQVNWSYLLQNQFQGMDSGYWPSDAALKMFTNTQNQNQPSE